MAKTKQENSGSAKNKKEIASSLPTIDLDISLIDENPDNRKIFNMEDIEKLAETIRREGFSGAIEVYRKADGRYEISAGHRRVTAMKSLGAKTIPAIVSDLPDSDVAKRTRLISSNINNREMTPMDWARAIAYHEDTLRMAHGLSSGQKAPKGINIIGELVEYFEFKEKTIANYKKLNRLVPELQKIVEAESAPWYVVADAAGLPKDLQTEFAADLQKLLATIASRDEKNDKPILTVGQVKASLANFQAKANPVEEPVTPAPYAKKLYPVNIPLSSPIPAAAPAPSPKEEKRAEKAPIPVPAPIEQEEPVEEPAYNDEPIVVSQLEDVLEDVLPVNEVSFPTEPEAVEEEEDMENEVSSDELYEVCDMIADIISRPIVRDLTARRVLKEQLQTLSGLL